jgi:hypothetical protein
MLSPVATVSGASSPKALLDAPEFNIVSPPWAAALTLTAR